jgi:hypothetical protein
VIVDRASVVAIDPRRAVRASRSTLDAPFARPSARSIARSLRMSDFRLFTHTKTVASRDAPRGFPSRRRRSRRRTPTRVAARTHTMAPSKKGGKTAAAPVVAHDEDDLIQVRRGFAIATATRRARMDGWMAARDRSDDGARDGARGTIDGAVKRAQRMRDAIGTRGRPKARRARGRGDDGDFG